MDQWYNPPNIITNIQVHTQKITLSFAHNPESVYKFEQIKIAIHPT